MLAFPVLPLTSPVVLEALRGVGEHLLYYYDPRSGRPPVSGRWPWSSVRTSTWGQYSTGCRSPTRWTPNSSSPLWARSLAGCR
jgi:hypothetical protein